MVVTVKLLGLLNGDACAAVMYGLLKTLVIVRVLRLETGCAGAPVNRSRELNNRLNRFYFS